MVHSTTRPRRSLRAPKPVKPLTWREFKTHKLVPAFKELRGIGIYTRTNKILCCGSCTHGEFGQIVDENEDEYDGYVGYHAQSVPMDAGGWDEPFDEIYLQHCIPNYAVKYVRDIFLKRGLAVDWYGDENKTILLRLPVPTSPLWQKLRMHVKHRALFFYWHGLTYHIHAKGGPESDMRQRSNIRYDPDAPNAPPAGLDPCFNKLRFSRSITFLPPPPYRIERLIEVGEYHEFNDEEGLFDGDPASKANMENYRNHGDVDTLKLSPPSRFDDDVSSFVELKGAELDAVAFRGPTLSLASYDILGGTLCSSKTFEAPAGNCFTIAELHAILEKHLHWLARAQQFQWRLDIDHSFFEELVVCPGNGVIHVEFGS